MSSRSILVLTMVSMSALSVAACNPKLPPSRDAPDPTRSGPPLRVDVVDPVEPSDEAPTVVQASDETPSPPSQPTQPVEAAEAAPNPPPATEAPGEVNPPPEVVPVSREPEAEAPRMTRVASHCRAEERTLYNCPFGEARALSVCAGDQIVYRFGPTDDPELELRRTAGEDGVLYSVVHRPGEAHQTQLRFRNGAYDYVVYSDQENRDSGVVVLRQGRPINRLQCPTASAQTHLPTEDIRRTIRPDRRQDRRNTWW